jgi:hypothetical protein
LVSRSSGWNNENVQTPNIVQQQQQISNQAAARGPPGIGNRVVEARPAAASNPMTRPPPQQTVSEKEIAAKV